MAQLIDELEGVKHSKGPSLLGLKDILGGGVQVNVVVEIRYKLNWSYPWSKLVLL